MRGRREWKECSRGPSEEERDRVREQSAHPTEVALYASATADDGGVPLGRERAGKKDREQQ
jgi:hypothetical protein